MNQFKYFLVFLVPDPVRNEQINVGVVGLYEDRVKAFFLRNPQKIKAVSPDYDTSHLFEDFQKLIEELPTGHAIEMLSNINDEFVHVYPPLSGAAKNYEHFEVTMHNLYDRLVKPAIKIKTKPKITKLKKAVTDKFRKKGLLGERLEEKKIVFNYVITQAEGLMADFAYHNGTFNIIETIDYRVQAQNLGEKFKDTAVSVVKIDEARKKIDRNAKGAVLYYPPDDDVQKIARHQALLSDYFDNIYNYADRSQLAQFFNRVERDLQCLLI